MTDKKSRVKKTTKKQGEIWKSIRVGVKLKKINMAKCTNCDSPYATGDKCPNCGSDNPSGGSTLTGILVFVFIVLALAKSCG